MNLNIVKCKNKETYKQRISRLKEKTSIEGWKGYRSIPVLKETWDRAESVAFFSLAKPFVSVGGDGSIWLSWRMGKDCVDIEVRPDGLFDWEEDCDGFECQEGLNKIYVITHINCFLIERFLWKISPYILFLILGFFISILFSC